ncbi:hypothetical protein LDENG_00213350 [Lucifuga dentata]|nr:hypothetical protein LDENG_00213350 [Lucifuga dentata]
MVRIIKLCFYNLIYILINAICILQSSFLSVLLLTSFHRYSLPQFRCFQCSS